MAEWSRQAYSLRCRAKAGAWVLAFLASGEQLTGAIQQLSLPLAHLNRLDGVIGGDLLDRPTTTDRLYGDFGLELWAVGTALAHQWEPH